MPPLAVGTPVAIIAAGDGLAVVSGPDADGIGGARGTDADAARPGGGNRDGVNRDGNPDGVVLDGPAGTVVAGTVVALDADVATIAVPAALAPRLVAALARGDLAVTLRGP
jgi:hypothetical protein